VWKVYVRGLFVLEPSLSKDVYEVYPLPYRKKNVFPIWYLPTEFPWDRYAQKVFIHKMPMWLGVIGMLPHAYIKQHLYFL